MTPCPAGTGLQGAGQLVPVREGKTRVVQPDGTEVQVQRVPLRRYMRWAPLVLWACTALIWGCRQHPGLFRAASGGPCKQTASRSIQQSLLEGNQPWPLPHLTSHQHAMLENL